MKKSGHEVQDHKSARLMFYKIDLCLAPSCVQNAADVVPVKYRNQLDGFKSDHVIITKLAHRWLGITRKQNLLFSLFPRRSNEFGN